MLLLIITHIVCVGLGCALWRYGVEAPYGRWRRLMLRQHARHLATKGRADRWQLEAEYLGEVVTRMTEVAKEQASLAKARSTVAETGVQNIDMMDEQEEKRVKRFRRG